MEIHSKSGQRASRKCRLTQRDSAILCYIGENGFSPIPDIGVKFWGNSRQRHEHRRLSKLRKAGYLEKLLGDYGVTLGYRLARKGKIFVQEMGVDIASLKWKPSYRTAFDHDKTLLRLREILEKSPLVSDYLPEHKVRAMLSKEYGRTEKRDEGFKVPDAIFNLKTTKGLFKVALELEASRKNFKRYRRLIRALATTRDADLIFIVSGDSKIRLLIQTLLKEAREKDPFVKISKKDNGFYFLLTENLLKDGLDAVWEGEGKRFSLSSIMRQIEEEEKQSGERPQNLSDEGQIDSHQMTEAEKTDLTR